MIYSLQAYRGIAAVLVVIFHVIRVMSKYLHDDSFGNTFEFGAAGVQFFFVLSGFIIYWVHARDLNHAERLGGYLKKRLIRIYPIYWICVIGLLPLLMLLGTKVSLGQVLLDLSLIPQADPPVVIGAAWTLTHEITFYLVFCTLIVSQRLGAFLLMLWALSISLLAIFYPDLPFPSNFFFNANNLLFLMGIVAAILQQKVVALQKGLGLALFIAGNLMFAAVAWAHVSYELDRHTAPVILAYGFASFLIVAGCATERVQKVFANYKWLLFLGDASYSIYLIHFAAIRAPVEVIRRLHLQEHVPSIVTLLVSTAFGVAVGCLLYAFVERPVLNFLQAKLIKRPAKSTPALATESPPV